MERLIYEMTFFYCIQYNLPKKKRNKTIESKVILFLKISFNFKLTINGVLKSNLISGIISSQKYFAH